MPTTDPMVTAQLNLAAAILDAWDRLLPGQVVVLRKRTDGEVEAACTPLETAIRHVHEIEARDAGRVG